MSKFIDLKTFNILENGVEIDDLIADAISILNKKGYYTTACCSGHNKSNIYQKQVCDIKLLDMDEINTNFPEGIIKNVNEKTFDLIAPFEITQVYVKFKDNYHFENIPEGFKLYTKFENEPLSNGFYMIEHIVEFYHNEKLRDNKELEDEIKKYNKILLDWVKKLPSRLKGND